MIYLATQSVSQITKNNMNTKTLKVYANILEWLYINDGAFPNKNEWREEFTTELFIQLNKITCVK